MASVTYKNFIEDLKPSEYRPADHVEYLAHARTKENIQLTAWRKAVITGVQMLSTGYAYSLVDIDGDDVVSDVPEKFIRARSTGETKKHGNQ